MNGPPPDGSPAGVYLHFPFCAERCSYCDFPTVAGRDHHIDPYLDALVREIERFQPRVPEQVDTVYVGGGTPSRMSADRLARVLAAVRARFQVAAGAEITIEANPESLDEHKLAGYLAAGVTRVSVGIQSFDDEVLRRAGRAHDAARARGAVRLAREAGVPEVSLDLIAGLPGEDLTSWGESVREAAGLGPDHVSVYLLETDKESPLARSIRAGRTPANDDERLVEAYETTVELLEERGLALYEISNFARPGHESRHNRKYWTDASYAGFGLGAHAYAGGERRANVRELGEYIRTLESGADPVASTDPWDPARRRSEALILGLRLREGIDLARLGARYSCDLRALHDEAWERASAAGLLEWRTDNVRLTPAGRLRSNELFAELIN